MNFLTKKLYFLLTAKHYAWDGKERMQNPRHPDRFPSDVSDEEWAFCAPYLTLMQEEAPQREYTPCVGFSMRCVT
jgi:hypothetical protein